MTEADDCTLANTIRVVMEQAGMAGLCREGQLEIGVQEARKVRPDLRDQELFALVSSEYEELRIGN